MEDVAELSKKDRIQGWLVMVGFLLALLVIFLVLCMVVVIGAVYAIISWFLSVTGISDMFKDLSSRGTDIGTSPA